MGRLSKKRWRIGGGALLIAAVLIIGGLVAKRSLVETRGGHPEPLATDAAGDVRGSNAPLFESTELSAIEADLMNTDLSELDALITQYERE